MTRAQSRPHACLPRVPLSNHRSRIASRQLIVCNPPQLAARPKPTSATDWQEAKTDDGRTYFWHTSSQETSWTMPAELKQKLAAEGGGGGAASKVALSEAEQEELGELLGRPRGMGSGDTAGARYTFFRRVSNGVQLYGGDDGNADTATGSAAAGTMVRVVDLRTMERVQPEWPVSGAS